MTPLVDVAFLLLTFFMFTTSMSRPQTMEINLPPDKDVKVEIAESNLLTLRVDREGRRSSGTPGIESPKRIAYNDLRAFLREQHRGKPQADRRCSRSTGTGKYNTMVEHDRRTDHSASITRFSLAPMSDKDKELAGEGSSVTEGRINYGQQ